MRAARWTSFLFAPSVAGGNCWGQRALNLLIRAELWALHLDAEAIGKIVRGSTVLWMMIREGTPRLRIYYVLHNDTCELMWLELDPEWSPSHST